MARTVIEVKHNLSYQEASRIIGRRLTAKGFKTVSYHGESVWKSGTGLMTAMKYVKVEFDEGSVTLSGWVMAGVGNVVANEMDLSGIAGALPKRQLMNVLLEIKNALQ